MILVVTEEYVIVVGMLCYSRAAPGCFLIFRLSERRQLMRFDALMRLSKIISFLYLLGISDILVLSVVGELAQEKTGRYPAKAFTGRFSSSSRRSNFRPLSLD